MCRFLVVSILSLVGITYGFTIQTRIINGIESDPSEFPFYVHVKGNSTCGGSIISDKWVLTAGHCTTIGNRVASVYLGFDSYYNFVQIMHVEAKDQYRHPKYTEVDVGYDIALMKLPESIVLGPNVQIAKLPTDCRSYPSANEAVIVAGSGYNSMDPELRDLPRLRHTFSRIISSDECAAILKSSSIGDVNQELLICADIIDGQTVSHGDSGGPLIRQDDGTLIGVIDFTVTNPTKLTDPQKRYILQISANIRYYFDWISTMTGLDMPKC